MSTGAWKQTGRIEGYSAPGAFNKASVRWMRERGGRNPELSKQTRQREVVRSLRDQLVTGEARVEVWPFGATLIALVRRKDGNVLGVGTTHRRGPRRVWRLLDEEPVFRQRKTVQRKNRKGDMTERACGPTQWVLGRFEPRTEEDPDRPVHARLLVVGRAFRNALDALANEPQQAEVAEVPGGMTAAFRALVNLGTFEDVDSKE